MLLSEIFLWEKPEKRVEFFNLNFIIFLCKKQGFFGEIQYKKRNKKTICKDELFPSVFKAPLCKGWISPSVGKMSA